MLCYGMVSYVMLCYGFMFTLTICQIIKDAQSNFKMTTRSTNDYCARDGME